MHSVEVAGRRLSALRHMVKLTSKLYTELTVYSITELLSLRIS